MFAPNGPIRDDLNLKLEGFFWELFYQLLRQQMLAFQMEKAHEAVTDLVRVLHISPVATPSCSSNIRVSPSSPRNRPWPLSTPFRAPFCNDFRGS